MTTDRMDEERADQANDAWWATAEAHDLLNTAHDVAVKVAALMDHAMSATTAREPEAVNGHMADARSIARQVAEMVGDWA